MFPSGMLPRGATWFTDNDVDVGSLSDHDITDDSNGRSAPANVTSMLTVTDVNINDNGTSYICGIFADLIFIRSNASFLTVGKSIRSLFHINVRMYVLRTYSR